MVTVKRYRVEKARKKEESRISQFGILLVATIMVSASVGYLIGADGPSGFGTVIEPGSMVSEADYIIFIDGSTYYAKNGTTGAMLASSTNLSEVFSDAKNALVGGGEIRFATGDFSLDTSLKPVEGLTISGSGHSSQITFTSYFGIEVNQDNVTVKNLHLIGSGSAMHGIGTGAVEYITIQNCWITDVDDDAIVLHGASYSMIDGNIVFNCNEGINVKAGGPHTIIHNQVREITDALYGSGIEVRYYDAIWGEIRDITVADNYVSDSYMGIEVIGGVDRLSILSNHINSVTKGITLGGLSNQSLRGVIVSGNQIQDTDYGLAFATATWYNVSISNNLFDDVRYYGVTIDVTGYGLGIHGNRFTDLDSSDGQAFVKVAAGNGIHIHDNAFIGFVNKHAVWASAGSDISVSDNQIQGSLSGSLGLNGIRLAVSNTVIHGNTYKYCTRGVYIDSQTNITISGGVFNACSYAIVSVNTADYITVVENAFYGMTTAVFSMTGTHNVIKYNVGYITENSGYSSVTGAVNTLTVTHGLVTTPTTVLLMGNNTGIGYYVVTQVTTVNFTITFETQPGTSEWKFYWYAEV